MFDHSFYLNDSDSLKDEKSNYTEFGSRINDLFFLQSQRKYFGLGFQRETAFQHGYKRKQLSSDSSEDNTVFNDSISKLLRRNSDILKAHLGAQNINDQLARDQQKHQTDIIVAALGKLTDALTKIADKL